MTPLPIYTFLVNNIDYQLIYSQPLPNSIDKVIGNLNEQSIYFPYLNRPLKNGDIFTLYGKRAQTVRDTFVGKSPKVLDLISSTSTIPVLINNTLEFDPSSLPLKTYFKCHEFCLINYSGKSITTTLKVFDSSDNPILVNLSQNGSTVSGELFNLSLENHGILSSFLSSDVDFYFTFDNLVFG